MLFLAITLGFFAVVGDSVPAAIFAAALLMYNVLDEAAALLITTMREQHKDA